MKEIRILRWFKNISISRKLYFTVGLMATLIVIELVVLAFSISTLSSVRAYVQGEGLWSKAQKDAMYQLVKYGRSHDEKDYNMFVEFMKVPLGDHKALIELYKPRPQMDIARQGFIEGRNHPEDVDGMINLFSRFNQVSYISKAISIWAAADRSVSSFNDIGQQLRDEINSPSHSQEEINMILASIDPINLRLTGLEDDFSYTLGQGSRWLENLILTILFIVALTVESTGLILTIIVSKNIQKGLNEIMQSASAVANGDFSVKATSFSKDEIGILANNFNRMSAELERSLREKEVAEKKFRGLLESAPDAIIMLDQKETIQLVNNRCEELFAYDKLELLGENIHKLFPRITLKRRRQMISFFGTRSRQLGSGFEILARNKKDEEFPVEIRLSPIETEEGMMVIAAVRDISERKYIRELELKNNELGQFAYISSHDMQEPLNTIVNFIDLLEEEYKVSLDEEGLSYLGYIKESSNRMTALISELLTYSSLGHSGDPEQIDCNEIVQHVLADMRAKIDKHETQIRISSLPSIMGYKVELRLLFQNLLSNAIKFKSKDSASSINLYATETEGYCHFTMEDNGIGIDRHHQKKIFDMFQRMNSREDYEGTGIGLAHCKKIVELHGGKIWVESELNMGSRFHFTLQKMELNEPEDENDPEMEIHKYSG